MSDKPGKTAQSQALSEALRILEGRKVEFNIKIPQTDDELWDATLKYCGIRIPRIKVCEHHCAPFTAFADAYFARSSTAIWEASRGFGGKTIMLAALAYMEAITLGAYVTLLGGSGEQSKRVHSYMRGDDPNVPDTFWGAHLAPVDLLYEDPTSMRTKLANGGAIIALAASQKSVRGAHPQRLRCLAGNTKILMQDGSEKEIKNVNVGDKIISYRAGQARGDVVQYTKYSGTKETVILFLDNGNFIQCTPDHKFLTMDGKWKEANDLLQKVQDRDAACETRKERLHGALRKLPPGKAFCSFSKMHRLWSKVEVSNLQNSFGKKKKAPTMHRLLQKTCSSAKESLRGLRESHWKTSDKMPVLSFQISRITRGVLHRLRNKGFDLCGKKMPFLPPQMDERKRGKKICASKGNGSRDQAQLNRNCLRRVAGLIPCFGVQGTATNSAIYCGLYSPGHKYYNRNPWSILARLARKYQERPKKEKRFGKDGLYSAGIKAKRDASLVDANGKSVQVLSIKRGSSIPVFDITVKNANNFIAEGVVTHNCDEIDEMDLVVLDAALGQPMENRGIKEHTVLSSTHQNPDGTMTEVKRRAPGNDWPIFEWCVSGKCDIMSVDGIIKMQDIQTGDIVYAQKDNKIIKTAVTDAWQSGTKQTIVVKTSSGKIVCTPDHRILTPSGWKQAGELNPGDLVQAVWNAESKNKFKNRKSFITQALSHLFGKQQMSKLRKDDNSKLKALRKLPLDINRSSKYSKNRKNNLPNLRRSKNSRRKTMPNLLSQRNDKAEHAQCWSNGKGQTANFPVWKRQKATKQSRTRRRGNVRQNELEIQARTASRSIRSKLYINGLRYSGSCERAILAQQSRANQEGQTKRNRIKENGKKACYSLDRRTPFMVTAVVESVKAGKVIPVYDITVADGASFIANGIVVHNCYRESLTPHGWLSPSSVKRKKKDITAQMWQVEYENQEPSPESRAILPDAIEAMFEGDIINVMPSENKIFEPRMAICQNKECKHEFAWTDYEWFEEIEREGLSPLKIKKYNPCPECGGLKMKSGLYATGADWARKRDWTVVLTFRTDCDPIRLVAFYRTQRQGWPVMIEALDKQIEHYDSYATHDATGLGDVVADYIRNPVEDILMVGRTRKDMLSNFIASIERGEIKAPKIEFMYNQFKYASVDDIFGTGHLPDSLSAGALAYLCFDYSGSLIIGI